MGKVDLENPYALLLRIKELLEIEKQTESLRAENERLREEINEYRSCIREYFSKDDCFGCVRNCFDPEKDNEPR